MAVFQRVLNLARERKILNGQTLGVDLTRLEPNAAMKSIVRKDAGKNWQTYRTTLMREVGMIGPDDTPSIDETKRFDKSQKLRKLPTRIRKALQILSAASPRRRMEPRIGSTKPSKRWTWKPTSS